MKPKITIDPTSGTVGEVITVSGTGFEDRAYMIITFDDYRISTTPLSLYTKGNGSFTGSFLVPSRAVRGTSKIRASDEDYNWAEAELTILTGISLDPATSQTSPGHVGMELTIHGTGFIAQTPITITYGKSTVATVPTDTKGTFSATFTLPPSIAGSHAITVTDGTDTLTATVTMESEAPLIPVPLLPEVATMTEGKTYFDWGDVDDPSGITYTLQIGADVDFTTIPLEQTGLTQSEYAFKVEEKLKSTGKDAPTDINNIDSYEIQVTNGLVFNVGNVITYNYPITFSDGTNGWRVRAIDGAFNEGKWTMPILFYVGRFYQEATPSWLPYLWIGLGALLLGMLGFWVFKRIKG